MRYVDFVQIDLFLVLVLVLASNLNHKKSTRDFHMFNFSQSPNWCIMKKCELNAIQII